MVISDLPGARKFGANTINPSLAITPLIPYMVIETPTEVFICELTVPFETNIDRRHTDKSNKYAHFITDITSKKCTVLPWEIGAC